MRRFWQQLGTATFMAAMLGIGGPAALRAQDNGLQVEHPPIVVGLPVPKAGSLGELDLEPNVDTSGRRPQPAARSAPEAPPVATGNLLGGLIGQGVIRTGGVLPEPQSVSTQPVGTMAGGLSIGAAGEELPQINGAPSVAAPIFAQTLSGQPVPVGGPPPGPGGLPYLGPPGTLLGGPGGGGPIDQPGGPAINLFGKPGRDGTYFGLGGVDQGSDEGGVGHERVMLAPFAIDTTQPQNDLRFRFDAGYHEQFPDRAEYFWAAAAGAGPKLPERNVDFQDEYFAMEAGSKTFSINTEIPIRSVDPVVNANTAGLGDMTVTTKTVLLTGNDWQITQLFRTDIPTGDPLKGLGTGHVGLEPGMLFRYKWNDETYFHGELEYWFPLGDNPIYGGEILTYGLGISHLYYENDSFAVIPTAELVAYTVFNGAQTTPEGVLQAVDSMTIVEFHPGIRFVCDSGGDLGLIEYGFSGSFPLTPNRWTDAYFLLEAKFTY